MFDQDGFFHIERIKPVVQNECTKQDNKMKKKKSKSKFKSGSWKYKLHQKLMSYQIPACVKDFHFHKFQNFVFLKPEDNNVLKQRMCMFNHKLDKSVRNKFDKDESSAVVMLNAGDMTYVQVSMDSYKKLCKISKMIISCTVYAVDDEEEETKVYTKTDTICNLSDLMAYIVQHRACVNGVYEIECNCMGYSYNRFDIKIIVELKDGSLKTYRSDMNDFMSDYGLYLF